MQGFQFALLHDGSSTASLWARLDGQGVTPVPETGIVNEYEVIALRIPRQDNFTGGIAEGDEITISTTGIDISANVYLVRSWEIENDGAVFVVNCDVKTARRSNP